MISPFPSAPERYSPVRIVSAAVSLVLSMGDVDEGFVCAALFSEEGIDGWAQKSRCDVKIDLTSGFMKTDIPSGRVFETDVVGGPSHQKKDFVASSGRTKDDNTNSSLDLAKPQLLY